MLEGVEHNEAVDLLIRGAKRKVAYFERVRKKGKMDSRCNNEDDLNYQFTLFRVQVDFFNDSLNTNVVAVPKELGKIMQNDSVPEEIKDYLRTLARELLPLMANNNFWYQAGVLSNFLGDYEEIDRHIEEYGAVYWAEGDQCYKVSPDLVFRALEKGDDRIVNRVMEQNVNAVGGADLNLMSDYIGDAVTKGEVFELVSEIRANLRKYIEKYGLEEKLPISTYHVNAAMEISRMDYDYIVGIYKGCTSLTTPLEIIGDNVRYVDYSRSRDPEGQPKWLQAGRVSDLPEKMDRVLVCEDDVVTGGTLRRVQKLIDGMEPESVDLRLHGVNYEESRDRASEQGYFGDIGNLHVGFARYVENLRDFNEILKRRLLEE